MSFLRRTEEGGEDDGEELAHIVGDEGEEIVAVEVEERPLRHLHAFATNNLPSETTTTRQQDDRISRSSTNKLSCLQEDKQHRNQNI